MRTKKANRCARCSNGRESATALGMAIELGDDDTTEIYRLLERLCCASSPHRLATMALDGSLHMGMLLRDGAGGELGRRDSQGTRPKDIRGTPDDE